MFRFMLIALLLAGCSFDLAELQPEDVVLADSGNIPDSGTVLPDLGMFVPDSSEPVLYAGTDSSEPVPDARTDLGRLDSGSPPADSGSPAPVDSGSPPADSGTPTSDSGTACPGTQVRCIAICEDLSTSHDHCGWCTNSCSPAQMCLMGRCFP